VHVGSFAYYFRNEENSGKIGKIKTLRIRPKHVGTAKKKRVDLKDTVV